MAGQERRYVIEQFRRGKEPTVRGPYAYDEALDVWRSEGGRIRVLSTSESRPRHPSYDTRTGRSVR